MQVAIVLQGRHAGKKVVIIKQVDESGKEKPFPYAIVAGVERYPRKVTRRMGPKKVQRRSKVKPFIKVRFIFWIVEYADTEVYADLLKDHQLLALVPHTICS
jgi:ribosomal protein L14E/L6E/L27E